MTKQEVEAVITAYKMVGLAAAYFEGYQVSAKDEYNTLNKSIDGFTASVICHLSPFNTHVVSVYEAYRHCAGFDLDLCKDNVNQMIDEIKKGI